MQFELFHRLRSMKSKKNPKKNKLLIINKSKMKKNLILIVSFLFFCACNSPQPQKSNEEKFDTAKELSNVSLIDSSSFKPQPAIISQIEKQLAGNIYKWGFIKMGFRVESKELIATAYKTAELTYNYTIDGNMVNAKFKSKKCFTDEPCKDGKDFLIRIENKNKIVWLTNDTPIELEVEKSETPEESVSQNSNEVAVQRQNSISEISSNRQVRRFESQQDVLYYLKDKTFINHYLPLAVESVTKTFNGFGNSSMK